MASLPKVCAYMDMPLQHVSVPVLRGMLRPSNGARYLEIIEDFRRRVPGITMRSTFIVGFPGETEEHVAELEDWIARAELDRVGFFTYSREDGTPGALLPDQVPEREKRKRLLRLRDAQRRASERARAKRAGTVVRVLVEERRTLRKTDPLAVALRERDVLVGRSMGEAPGVDGGDRVRVRSERADRRVRRRAARRQHRVRFLRVARARARARRCVRVSKQIVADPPAPPEPPTDDRPRRRSDPPPGGDTPPSRWRHVLAYVLAAVLIVVGVVCGFVAYRVFHDHQPVPRSISEIFIPSPSSVFGKERIYVMVLGTDYNRDEKGMPYSKGARSDTIMAAGLDFPSQLAQARVGPARLRRDRSTGTRRRSTRRTRRAASSSPTR